MEYGEFITGLFIVVVLVLFIVVVLLWIYYEHKVFVTSRLAPSKFHGQLIGQNNDECVFPIDGNTE